MNRTITITGRVIPAAWDDLDRVCGVAIETGDFEQYPVEPDTAAAVDLCELSGRRVSVLGRFSPTEAHVRVESFVVFREPDGTDE